MESSSARASHRVSRRVAGIVLVLVAIAALAPRSRRFVEIAAAFTRWLPWAALVVVGIGLLSASPALLRALPLVVVLGLLVGYLAPWHVDPLDAWNLLATVGLLTGALISVNLAAPRSVRALLWTGRYAHEAEEYAGGRVTAVLGHARLDVRQARLTSPRGGVVITVVAGTVLVELPAEWRLVVRCPVGVVVVERGVPRDSAGSPLFDISVRGVLGHVEIARQ